MSTHLYDVFISHATEDLKVAEAIAHHLESGRARTYLARQQIHAGTSWRAELARAIEASRSVVLIVSEYSNQSKHVRDEVTLACESGLTIFPFKLENVRLHDELKMPLAGTHWLDAIDPPLEAHIQRLASDVCAKLSIPSEGQKPPPPPRARKHDRLIVGVAAVLVMVLGFLGSNITLKTIAQWNSAPADQKPPLPSQNKFPKVELLTREDQPLDGKTVLAQRGANCLYFQGGQPCDNGIDGLIHLRVTSGKLAGNAVYELQYQAEESVGIAANSMQGATKASWWSYLLPAKVDREVITTVEGNGPWSAVRRIPQEDGKPYKFASIFPLMTERSATTTLVVGAYAGKNGWFPPGPMKVRLVIYGGGDEDNENHRKNPKLAEADFTLVVPP